MRGTEEGAKFEPVDESSNERETVCEDEFDSDDGVVDVAATVAAAMSGRDSSNDASDGVDDPFDGGFLFFFEGVALGDFAIDKGVVER